MPQRNFCKTKASRKRWLITKEDREKYEEMVLKKKVDAYEKLRNSLKGAYELVYLAEMKTRLP